MRRQLSWAPARLQPLRRWARLRPPRGSEAVPFLKLPKSRVLACVSVAGVIYNSLGGFGGFKEVFAGARHTRAMPKPWSSPDVHVPPQMLVLRIQGPMTPPKASGPRHSMHVPIVQAQFLRPRSVLYIVCSGSHPMHATCTGSTCTGNPSGSVASHEVGML